MSQQHFWAHSKCVLYSSLMKEGYCWKSGENSMQQTHWENSYETDTVYHKSEYTFHI